MSARNRVFVSYASADKKIARRIVKCLERKHEGMLWFDEREIVWGDNIVTEINAGLHDSLMGIVIFSDSFFQRRMPQLELSAMITLMNTVDFRILPLFHNFSHDDLASTYPLLGPIRGEMASQPCESLTEKFGKALSKTRQTVILPVGARFRPPPSKITSDVDVKDVDQSELKRIFDDITGGSGTNRRSAAITTLRRYSDTRRIWNHDISWDIALNLIGSPDNSDIKDGLYMLEYMIKTSGKIGDKDQNNVKELIRLRFGSLLVQLTYRTDDRRIPFDSFVILKEITKKEALAEYALGAILTAMAEIENENDYTRYIGIFVSYLEATSYQTKKRVCEIMYELTSRQDRVGERAKTLHEHFIRLI